VSYQRRRKGQPVTIYPTKEITDSRGNKTRVWDPDNPIHTRAAVIPGRSSRAEVPGQQAIHVTTLIITHELPGVDLWSRVDYLGQVWDVVTPPAFHYGSRNVRHWSINIRERP
jgi:hypothetical protein